MDELQKLRAENDMYRKMLRLGEDDVAVESYIIFVGILKQQNDILKNFVIKDKVDSVKKEDEAAFKNVKEMWEKLPTLIEKTVALRERLGISRPVIQETNEKPVTAASISQGHVLPD